MSQNNSELIAQAQAALDRFESAAALALLEPLRGKDDSAPYLACLIEAQAQARDFAGAEATVAGATAMHPDDLALCLATGMAAVQARDYALAEQRYLRAAQLRPGYAPTHNNLGMVLEYLHRDEEAVAAYRHAIELDPALVPAYRNLGRMAEIAGRLDEARAHYEQGQAGTGAKEEFAALLAGLGNNFKVAESASVPNAENLLAAELARAAERHLPGDRKLAVIDLICGAGVVGSMLWRKVGAIIGVDPRIHLLPTAQQAGVYYDLKDQRPAAFLRTCKRGETDLIVSNSGFLDQGDLLAVFLDIYAVLAPGGLLVMIFLSTEDSLGYRIETNDLYSHDPAYVRSRADFEGLEFVEQVDYPVGTLPGTDSPHTLMVFRKPH